MNEWIVQFLQGYFKTWALVSLQLYLISLLFSSLLVYFIHVLHATSCAVFCTCCISSRIYHYDYF